MKKQFTHSSDISINNPRSLQHFYGEIVLECIIV
uniref:Uncharacterized protein n=1 Tax=Anguilla anguilla TaxID=7936 RepID=A0A0E9RDQ3_ANGAN